MSTPKTLSESPTVADGAVASGNGRVVPTDGSDKVGPLVRIRSLLPGLARAEQRVAKVVLEDPSRVARQSITEVALAADTSETTVTRFCKAIGVGGYPQLRIALAADTARTAARTSRSYGGDIEAGDELATVVSKIGFMDARAVEETTEQLEIVVLRQVVEAVAHTSRVDIYGLGASAFVAGDLQQKLHRIGKIGFAWSDTHVMLTSATILGPGDVAIAISHSGATSDTVNALRIARERGATTVAITNFPRSPISKVAEHVLTTAARETTFLTGATASRIAQLTVIDCLFVGVAQLCGATAILALDAARQAAAAHQLGVRRDGRRNPKPRLAVDSTA